MINPKLEEKIAFALLRACGLVVISVLFIMVGYLFIKGVGAINLELFFGEGNSL